MPTILDDKYEQLAAQFQFEQIRMLKAVLERHGIIGMAAKKICGEFTFDLSVFIDQGEIEIGDEAYRPSIAFTSDEESFYIQPGNLEYHEYAFGSVADIFEGKS